MANNQFYHLLYLLRYGKQQENEDALLQLKEMEGNGDVEPKEIIALSKEAIDPVTQNYVIGAIERLRIEEGYPWLKDLYLKSNNPILLLSLLEVFQQLERDEFLKIVLKKLKNPRIDTKKKKQEGFFMDDIFDGEFIQDQILIPSLRYLQEHGTPSIKKDILPFLQQHSDKKVRWHALVALDKSGVELDHKLLKQLVSTESDNAIREQVKVILERKN